MHPPHNPFDLNDWDDEPDETPDGEFVRGCFWTFLTLAAAGMIVLALHLATH